VLSNQLHLHGIPVFRSVIFSSFTGHFVAAIGTSLIQAVIWFSARYFFFSFSWFFSGITLFFSFFFFFVNRFRGPLVYSFAEISGTATSIGGTSRGHNVRNRNGDGIKRITTYSAGSAATEVRLGDVCAFVRAKIGRLVVRLSKKTTRCVGGYTADRFSRRIVSKRSVRELI